MAMLGEDLALDVPDVRDLGVHGCGVDSDRPDGSSSPLSKAASKRARDIQAAARTKRKQRAELLQLRVLAAALETRRNALLAAGATFDRKRPGVGPPQDDAAASEAATAEARQLNESRALNSRLRKLVKQQRGAVDAVLQVLKRRFDDKAMQDLLAEMRMHSTGYQAHTHVTSERLDVKAIAPSARCRLSQDIYACLREFSAQASEAVATVTREGIVSRSHTRIVRDVPNGPMVEMVSSTLVQCDLDDGWSVAMRVLGDTLPPVGPPRAYGYSVQRRFNLLLNVSEKDFSMAFASGLVFDGLVFFDAFGSNDMKLFVWAAVVCVRGDGTFVRERGWTAMTRACCAASSCVLHSHYELHTPRSKKPSSKTQLLTDSLLHKARNDQRNLENAMAAQFGSDVPLASLLYGQ